MNELINKDMSTMFGLLTKKMNKLHLKTSVVLVISIICIGLFFGCKTNSNVKIGFLMPASEGFRWPTDQRYIEMAAKELGVTVISRSAENDENLQLKLATELLEEGAKVLIVVPVNANTSAAIVRKAHEYNVPVIAYDRLIKNTDLDYFVTFDSGKIGALMLEFALERKPKGNYVILWGDGGDVNAHLIKESQEKILQPVIESGQITIVYKSFVEDWSKENAYQIMKRILSLSDKKIDAVITSYDGIALGAIKAMNEFDIQGDIIVTGQDAELEAIHSILDNTMSLTVYKSIDKIARSSVDLAIKLATHQRVKETGDYIDNGRKNVETLFLMPTVITKNNIRETLIADKIYSEEQVFSSN